MKRTILLIWLLLGLGSGAGLAVLGSSGSAEPTATASTAPAITTTSASRTAASAPSPTVSVVVSPEIPPAPIVGAVVINEVMANPTGTDTGHEWLELYNQSDTNSNLSGTKVQRASGTTVSVIPSGTVLAPHQFLVLSQLTSSLINTGDTLVLVLGTTELDRLSYDGSGSEGYSFIRLGPNQGTWTTQPTPGASNVMGVPSESPTPTPSPVTSPTPAISMTPSPSPSVPLPQLGEVWINELLPNPDGTDSDHEWIELFNTTDNLLDLSGANILRQNGSNLVTVPDSTILAGRDYLLLTSLSGSLVNTLDTLQLALDGQVVDEVEYDEAPEGESWARMSQTEGDWTTTLTPGSANVMTAAVGAVVEETTVSTPAAPAAKATASTAKKASTAKPKASTAKKASAKSSTLPKTGISVFGYLLPILILSGIWYWRWRQQ